MSARLSSRFLHVALVALVLLCPLSAVAQSANQAFFDTPQGRLWHQGVSSTGMSPDSLLSALERANYDSVRTLAARGVSSLPIEEQREVIAIRLTFARSMPTELCASSLWDGATAASAATDQPAMAYMSPEDQDRLVYLSARSIALLLQGRTASPEPMAPDAFWAFVEEKATPKQFSQLNAALEDDATPDAKCRAVQALYQFLMRLPARAPTSARVISHVLSTMAM